MKPRLRHTAAVLMLSSGGGAALAFLLSVLIGRVLGEAGLGIYAAVLAWVLPLSIIAEFGLGTLITRDVAQNPTLTHAYLRTSVQARLWLGGGLLLLLWWLAPLLSDDLLIVQGLRISAPLLLIYPLFGGFSAVFRAHQVVAPIAWLNIGMLLIQVALTALAFALGAGVLVALLLNTLTSAGQLVAAWWVYRQRFHSAKHQPSKPHIAVWPLLRQSWPFALAAILSAAYVRISLILLEQTVSVAQVGQYAAAWRFVDAGVLLARAFFDALLPALAASTDNPAGLARRFGHVQLGLLLAGVLFGVGVSLLASPILNLTYGPQFADAVPLLQLAAWSLLPLLLKNARIVYAYAQGHEARVNRVLLLTLIVRVLLSLWLIPASGASGAIWANMLSDLAGFVLLLAPRESSSLEDTRQR